MRTYNASRRQLVDPGMFCSALDASIHHDSGFQANLTPSLNVVMEDIKVVTRNARKCRDNA